MANPLRRRWPFEQARWPRSLLLANPWKLKTWTAGLQACVHIGAISQSLRGSLGPVTVIRDSMNVKRRGFVWPLRSVGMPDFSAAVATAVGIRSTN